MVNQPGRTAAVLARFYREFARKASRLAADLDPNIHELVGAQHRSQKLFSESRPFGGQFRTSVQELTALSGDEIGLRRHRHWTEISQRVLDTCAGPCDREVVSLYRPTPGVAVDPQIRGGYPVIAGTRGPYDMVASLLEDGVTAEEVARFYPAVSATAARGALAFAR